MNQILGPIQRFSDSLGAASNSQQIIDLIKKLAAPFEVTEFDDSVYFTFNRRGVELLFENRILTAVHIYTQDHAAADPAETYSAFPLPLINGLPPTATRSAVTALLGTPSNASTHWVRYLADRVFITFAFDANGRTELVSVTQDDVLLPAEAEEEEEEVPYSERLIMTGSHLRDAATEQVIFTDGNTTLSFTRRLDTSDPVIIGWDGLESVGGVRSVWLAEDNSLLLQLSEEAAAKIELFDKSRFWIAEDCDAEELYDALVAMLEATGEFDPARY